MTEEIFVGIDADTMIAPGRDLQADAALRDPEVGAVAGNAKVGNRVNLWTRWQALEYITSQNLDRRAFKRSARQGGARRDGRVAQRGIARRRRLRPDTVAEDADLTMALL